VTSNDD
jgi:hypothetical protein